MSCRNGVVAAFYLLTDSPEGFAMKRTVYRRMPEKQPRAVAIARTAPKIPAVALIAAAAFAFIISLALRGLL